MDNIENTLIDIITEAKNKKASDIHFMVESDVSCVYFRINESLKIYFKLSYEKYKKLVRYIKYRSNMNLNISKTPQSSSLDLMISNKLLRIRISTLPTKEYESIVIRLSNNKYSSNLDGLFLLDSQKELIRKTFNLKNGLVILSGPTGSGKTTLVYSVLSELKKHTNKNIITIEDPVEIIRDGLVQLQVNEDAGINYETSIKQVLRHDPDVIMIGEIRDEKTAKCVIRAALSGHLVFTTLHAKDIITAIYRLIEFGISIFDIEQTLKFLINQRLVSVEDYKQIVYEYINEENINDLLDYIKSGKDFSYKKIVDYIMEMDEITLIK